MLGVRRFRECQLDLWVGRSEDFACDARSNAISNVDFAAVGGKHLSLLAAPRIWIDLKEKLKTASSLPRRVTIICASVEEYEALQEQLFTEFND